MYHALEKYNQLRINEPVSPFEIKRSFLILLKDDVSTAQNEKS
jgi:hypothetical protein